MTQTILLSRAQSDGVLINMAGETAGVRAGALVDDPLEPRLFVYRRDGSALELLREQDAQRWRDRLVPTPKTAVSQQQQHRRRKRGGIYPSEGANAVGTSAQLSACVVREEQCCVDPHSLGARQVRGTVGGLRNVRVAQNIFQHLHRIYGDMHLMQSAKQSLLRDVTF